MPFSDSPQTHHEPQFTGGKIGLIRMRNDRWVKQSGGLKRVFLGEVRTDKQSTIFAQRYICEHILAQRFETLFEEPFRSLMSIVKIL